MQTNVARMMERLTVRNAIAEAAWQSDWLRSVQTSGTFPALSTPPVKRKPAGKKGK